jgi:hypothetical protein
MLILFKGIEITSVFLAKFLANFGFLQVISIYRQCSVITWKHFISSWESQRHRITMRRSFPAIAPHPWIGYNKVGLRKNGYR